MSPHNNDIPFKQRNSKSSRRSFHSSTKLFHVYQFQVEDILTVPIIRSMNLIPYLYTFANRRSEYSTKVRYSSVDIWCLINDSKCRYKRQVHKRK
jgi:hypothetical protein